MLIQFQDALKPYGNLKLPHRGYVVKIDDPLNLGRIKCKVEGVIEAESIDRLPWCFPKQPITRGGRTDSGETAVPPLYSMVLISFPMSNDSPINGGNVYFPVWEGMHRTDLSNPGIAVTNGITEDGGLSEPYGAGASKAEDLEVNVWVKTQSQNVAWTRIDKNKGSVEFFDQDSGATIRVDRGGHAQMQITSLDVVTSEDVRFKVAGNFHVQVAGQTFIESQGDVGMQTAANFGIKAGGNIDDKAGGSVGVQAGATIGMLAGTDFGVNATANTSIKSGASSTLQSGDGIALVAVGLISEKGAVCARDAATISDNGGLSTGPLSQPPEALGTNDTVVEELTTSSTKVKDRATALAAIVAVLKADAGKVKALGQEILAKVKGWAAALVGKPI